MSIDSHVQYILFSFYTIVKLTQYITLFYYVITVLKYHQSTRASVKLAAAVAASMAVAAAQSTATAHSATAAAQ